MMDKLLIIADDFTGALDTGIQFTNMGIRARMVTCYDYDLTQMRPGDAVLSANTDTRPLTPEEAYHHVYTLAKNAQQVGFDKAYKKTDSGLRGNIGSELKAAMDAYDQKALPFIPALPRLNRITKNGVQFIDGIPVSESVFGIDPFEPVIYSDIADIIHSQVDLKVVKIPRDAYRSVDFSVDKQTVFLFDCETEDDLFAIADILREKGMNTLIAGCAGFAAAYERVMDFPKGNPHYMQHSDGLLALCGSVNPITVHQLDIAEGLGFVRESLTNEQKVDIRDLPDVDSFLDALAERISKHDRYIVETLDGALEEGIDKYARKKGIDWNDLRFCISDSLGFIAKGLVERNLNYTFSLTGGDTLMGFMKCVDKKELVPICEIGKGAVLSAMRWNGKRIQVISKSGGFGEADIFQKMAECVMNPVLPPQ